MFPRAAGEHSSIEALTPLMRELLARLDELVDAEAAGQKTAAELVTLSDRVSTARAALYEELMRQGWRPCPGVLHEMHVDAELRREGLGAAFESGARQLVPRAQAGGVTDEQAV